MRCKSWIQVQVRLTARVVANATSSTAGTRLTPPTGDVRKNRRVSTTLTNTIAGIVLWASTHASQHFWPFCHSSVLAAWADGRNAMPPTPTTYGNLAEVFKLGEGIIESTGSFFGGSMDDARVYQCALCPDESFDLYKGGRAAGVRILQRTEVR